LEAFEISEYPGAAGPVNGWVLPIVMVVAVIPGADAVGPLADELPHAVARNERPTPSVSNPFHLAGRESLFLTAISGHLHHAVDWKQHHKRHGAFMLGYD
jgi:hypothetical protein